VNFPIRHSTHRIDTRATRIFLNALPDDVLVREMSERDYGVDLALEVWNAGSPTGQFVFAQCKGTEKILVVKDCEITFGIPLKTLRYAEAFTAPFFLVCTSLANKAVYFLWLQKFARLRLDTDDPAWRKSGQELISVKIPARNRLDENEGKELFLARCGEATMAASSLEFLKAFATWSLHWEHWLEKQSRNTAAKVLATLFQWPEVLTKYQYSGVEIDIALAELKKCTDKRDFWQSFFYNMKLVEVGILNSEEIEEFQLDNTGGVDPPY
jgi:hypothetical protein